jgi:hypothetical protein
MKRKEPSFEGNIMKPENFGVRPFNDRIVKTDLIPISKIKTLFQGYDHQQLERYQQSIVWHDVGALFFCLHIKEKYKDLCEIPFTWKDLKEFYEKDQTVLEWVQNIDLMMDEIDRPLFLVYYKDHKFYFDSSLFSTSSKLKILIVSHIFPQGSGHLGCLLIKKDKVFYYDPNGLKDPDEKEYYDLFEKNLSKEMKKFNYTYLPYRWKKGIQPIQTSEEGKFGLNQLMGQCCAWTFLMIELKLMNPHLTIEEIETKIKNKYEHKLTRMIITYHQEIHKILTDHSNQIFRNLKLFFNQ